jgi:hypothetical protein
MNRKSLARLGIRRELAKSIYVQTIDRADFINIMKPPAAFLQNEQTGFVGLQEVVDKGTFTYCKDITQCLVDPFTHDGVNI